MPHRNLIFIAVTAVLSLICYEKAGRNRYASIITDVMALVEQHYIQPVQRRELFEHAMAGMIGGLDPYSSFISHEQYGAFRETIEQKFGGIGIEVGLHPETKRLTVLSPLFGTPAHKAGILSGDTILKIEDRDTEGMDLRAAVELMRGPSGTPIRVTILHRGETEPVELTLTRTEIRTETVLGDRRLPQGEWDFHLQSDRRIAYIRINTFGDDTATELKRTLQAAAKSDEPFEAIILDLRNNPGGTLYGAIEVADMFLESGTIVTTRGRDGRTKDAYTADSELLVDPEIPVAVLVNHYSASASEIVAACLQDHHRATIIGERTWGKGTVQNVIALESGKCAVRLTTSSYWRPSNHNIHRQEDAPESEEWGVSPDPGFEVKLTEKQFEAIFESRAKRDAHGTLDNPKSPPAPGESLPGTKVDPPSDLKDPGQSQTPAQEADEKPADPTTVEDPQLNRAVSHLQELLRRRAAPAKSP